MDDDKVSTTASNNNHNKMSNEESMTHCDCDLCYHKSYKTRHLNSKKILKDKEVKTNKMKKLRSIKMTY